MIHHPIFNEIKPLIDKELENKFYFLSPIGSENFNNFKYFLNEYNPNLASSEDNYEIFSNILKIDIAAYLKKKGIIRYKPKILEIPQYFSLHFPESEDYSINDYENYENDMNSIKKIKNKHMKNNELIFDKELNEKSFYEGSLMLIGHSVIYLPKDYEKEYSRLDKIIQNDFFIQELSSGLNDNNNSASNNSLLSDNSSTHSKLSSIASIPKIEFKTAQAGNVGGGLSNNNFGSKGYCGLQNIASLEKDIINYFKIKNIVYKILYKIDNFKRDDLIIELKKTNYFIPNNLRYLIYCIILDVDYIVQSEEYEIGNFYENKEFIINEMNQIKKDIIRCEEYDILYKTEEGKHYLKNLFEVLLYNKEDFFYIQGMDSIAAAFIKLYYPENELYFQVFYKFIKKLTFNFLDLEKKTIKNLEFHHLIISRIIAFIEPDLYLYLDSISFFEDLYASCWLITLFSSK